MVRVLACIALAGLLWVAGCTSRIHSTPPSSAPSATGVYDAKTRPYTVMGRTYYPLKSARGYDEVGMASWYGSDFHGKKTASGHVYDMYGLSAAHKTLPLGTRVRVTNLANDRSVVLLVNDRGPFVHGRVLDLSYGAAKRLGTVEQGVARVRITAVSSQPLNRPQPEQAAVKRYHVRVGAFAVRANAERVHGRLVGAGYSGANIVTVSRDGRVLHIVQAGSFPSRDEAEEVLVRLKDEYPTSYILG
ncbi:MAG: septal ring lytic transglycosylase RlpA family protein [Desulfovibrionaceae bacterium]|nr:septal ring lytic transglycosylase RlpA family protein [Desulfovibrionaceae bacterium]